MSKRTPDTFYQLIRGLYSSDMREQVHQRKPIGEYWASKDQRRHPRGRRVLDAFDVICTEKCCNK